MYLDQGGFHGNQSAAKKNYADRMNISTVSAPSEVHLKWKWHNARHLVRNTLFTIDRNGCMIHGRQCRQVPDRHGHFNGSIIQCNTVGTG